MNLQNFIPPSRGLGSENKFSENLDSTYESLSREHWWGREASKKQKRALCLVNGRCGTKVPLFKERFWPF